MKLQHLVDRLLSQVRRWVSPVFLVLLVASMILWYIAKLNYTYTTEQTIRVRVEGVSFEVQSVVEGVGTKLFGYRYYMKRRLRIPLDELVYTRSCEQGKKGVVVLDPSSFQNAISVRFSDIKVLSIGAIPELDIPVEP